MSRKLCGWKLNTICIDKRWRKEGELGDLPDYLADLNAMHEAEKTLTHDQHRIFWQHLWEMTREEADESLHWRRFYSATARQRAEAFVAVMKVCLRRSE